MHDIPADIHDQERRIERTVNVVAIRTIIMSAPCRIKKQLPGRFGRRERKTDGTGKNARVDRFQLLPPKKSKINDSFSNMQACLFVNRL